MLNELNILERLQPFLTARADVPVGPGDDCAAMEWGGSGEWLLAAVDQLAGDVHFYRNTTPPARAGAKLLKRNLSDIAAMGGVPRWALLAIAADGRDEEYVFQFCRGTAEAAARYGVNLAGGDIGSLRPGANAEIASLTILGTVSRDEIVRRSGARPGDRIFVTGTLGNTLASEHHLDFEPRLAEGRFLASHKIAHAMMDISDGLLLDAARMARASGVGMVIDPAKLPLRHGASVESALTGGEDYELLFTADAQPADWPYAPLTEIGHVVSYREGAVRIAAPDGTDLLANRRGGYEH